MPTEAPGSDLLDTTWDLDAYLADFKDDSLTEKIPDVSVDLIFDEDGKFSGNAGCNTYSGRYVTDEIQIVFTDFSVLMQICEEPQGIMEQETLYLRLLERIQEYRIYADEQAELITYELNADNEREEKIILVYEGLRAENADSYNCINNDQICKKFPWVFPILVLAVLMVTGFRSCGTAEVTSPPLATSSPSVSTTDTPKSITPTPEPTFARRLKVLYCHQRPPHLP